MKSLLLITTLLLTGLSASYASADNYTRSIHSCESAISNQMGIDQSQLRLKIDKIKTRSRHRNIKFYVYADGAPRSERVVVDCQVKLKGQILALDFSDSRYPVAMATKNGAATPTRKSDS